MAITILKKPKAVVWSKNPVIFEFSTDNRYSQPGSIYVGEIDFSESVDVEGYSFVLQWKGVSYEFTFKAVPNDSGQELPLHLPSINIDEWRSNIAAAFNSFYPLYEDFYITYEAGKIKFVSRKTAASMNLALISFSSGMNMSLHVVQAATDQIARDNFAFFMEICIQNEEGGFDSFTRSVIEVDSESKAIWDIQEYITSALLQGNGPKPDFNTTTIFKENISCRNFYLRFAEMFGYPQQMKILGTTEVITAVLGGVSLEHIDAYAFPEYLKEEVINKWVTNTPIKTILPKQKDYTCIINLQEDMLEVVLNINLYYSDQKLVKENLNIGSWIKNQKLHIPVGIQQLATLLNKDIGKPNSISLSLRKNDSLISNSVEFRIIETYFPYSNVLMFMNSLGCYESIYTYGKSELSYSIDKNDRAIEHRVDRDFSEGSIKEINVQIRNEIKLSSGYRSQGDILKFRDFILSKSKFILHKGKYVPVVLDSSSIAEFQDGNHLHAIVFTVKFSNEEILYSE